MIYFPLFITISRTHIQSTKKWRKIQKNSKKFYLTTGGRGGKGPLLSNDADLRNISDPLLK